MHYQLVLASQPSPEINYIPTFLDALEGEEVEDYENAKILQKILPDYLCENLSFPFDTLAQFYGKVNRALNKK
ncbi:Chromosome segregation protein Csm1/Pcs1 [Chlamydia trachomatis]|nr:Chromosome segregation protein Csm1/Pcs1 [Chlamydia trachomatis]